MNEHIKDDRREDVVITDERIIELYWERDQRAIEETDRKYGRFLFGMAYNMLGDKGDSEECKNDTYLRVWNAVPPERPVAFQAYLSQIIRRLAIKRYRMRTSQKRIPSELMVSMEELETALKGGRPMGDEDEIAAEELGKHISDYVRGLSEKQRYIFMSRYYFAEPTERIANDLRLTKSSIYKELTKIKNGLRKYLERNGIYV